VFLPHRYHERSQAEVASAAQKAETDHCAVKGVLGKSPLSEMLNTGFAKRYQFLNFKASYLFNHCM